MTMKRLLALALCLAMVFSLAACGSSKKEEPVAEVTEAPAEATEEPAAEEPEEAPEEPEAPAEADSETDAEEPAEEENDTEEEDDDQTSHRRRNSVFQYIAVLFAAAFVLLLFTYLMERRQYEQKEQHDQQQIESLNEQSVSAVQSLKDLYDENDALNKRVEELEGLLEEAQSTIASNAAAAEEAQKTLERTKVAMDWFWQLNEAFVRGRPAVCRDIIGILDADQPDSLSSYLPRESATDNLRFSPYDRYMEIRDAVA